MLRATVLRHTQYLPWILIMLFIFSILSCFDILGVLLARERPPLPSQEELIPRDSKWVPCEHAFHLQTNQSKAHISNHLLCLTLTGQPSASRARYWRTMTQPIAQSLLKSCKLSNSKLAQTCLPAPSIPSQGNRNKGEIMLSLLLLLPPEWSQYFPLEPCKVLPVPCSWELWVINLLSWQWLVYAITRSPL